MGFWLLVVFVLLGVALWRVHRLQDRVLTLESSLIRLRNAVRQAEVTRDVPAAPAETDLLPPEPQPESPTAVSPWEPADEPGSTSETGSATEIGAPAALDAPAAPSSVAATQPDAPTAEPSPRDALPPASRPAPAAPRLGTEAFVGGRLLLYAGVVTVLFGIAFFLKYAFDRELIGPQARVLLGAAVGVAAIVVGDRLHRRDLRAFAQGLMGLGLGALYLSVFFAATRYGLLGETTAFAATALITATGAGLAIWRDAQILAWLGFLGGLLAPLLLGPDRDSLEPLAVWLVLIDVGLVVVLWRRGWAGLELLSLAFSVLYLVLWHENHFTPARLGPASAVLSVRTLAILALSLLPPILTGRRLQATSLFAVVAVGVLGVSAGHELLVPAHQLPLAGAVAALSLLYAGAGWMLATHPSAGEREGDVLYAVGLAGLAAVVPLVTSGRVVAPAWAAAGLACVFAATVQRRVVFAACGVVMCALALCNLVVELPMHDARFLLFANGDFIAYAFPFLALAGSGWLLATRDVSSNPPARNRGRPGRLLILLAAWLAIPLVPAEIMWHIDLDRASTDPAKGELIWGWGAIGMAVYAAGFAWFGRSESRAIRGLPRLPWIIAGLWTLGLASFGHSGPFTAFANVVFVGGAAVVGAGALIASRGRGFSRTVLGPAAGLLAVYLLTAEIYLYGERAVGTTAERVAAAHAAQVWISIAWTLCAALAMGVGFARRRRAFRVAGLCVFAATIAKVFFVDLSMLETVYRIGSFMVLGVLLVGASFLYQRFSGALGEPEDARDPPTAGDV